MNTRIISAALAGIISVLGVRVSAQVTVSSPATNGLNEPYNVVVDATNNFYVSDSSNNRIVRFEGSTGAGSTLAGLPGDAPGSNDGPPEEAHFNNPQGLLAVSLRGVDGLLVADSGNNLIRFVSFSDRVVTTLAGQTDAGPALNAASLTATFRTPIGLAQDTNGNVYIADWGNNAIRVMNLNDPAFGITNVDISGTSLYRPSAVAFAGTNQLWVADTGNQMVKLITLATPTSGSLTAYLGGYRLKGTADSYFGPNARFDNPSGLLWVDGLGLLISDTLNNSIRLATNYAAYGPTNYAVITFAGTSGEGNAGLQDGSAASCEFNSPYGLAQQGYNTFLVADLKNNAIRLIQDGPPRPQAPTILSVLASYGQVMLSWSAPRGATSYNVKRSPSDGGPYTTIANVSSTNYTDTTVINGTMYYYVVSGVGAGGEGPNSAQVSARPPLPPVPDPQIGWVNYPQPDYVSVFHPFLTYIAYNDTDLVIKGTPGSSTWYTYGYTNDESAVRDPSTNSASIPSDYMDGLLPNEVYQYKISQVAPYLTIKAKGTKTDGSPDSAIVTSFIQFVTGNPNVNGNNAAEFTISDITVGAHLYYTTDGTDPSPTNGVDLGIAPNVSNVWTVGFAIFNDTWLKVRAYKDQYQPSAIVSNYFSATNLIANTISFGFAAGEASSDFVGSPGQFFYAPVTLTPLSGATVYSLQFNLTVTNAGPSPGPAMVPGAYGFQSFLEKPIPNTQPVLYERIPPLMFAEYATNPPPPSATVYLDGMPFVSLLVANTNINLLGVGWVERFGATNLYDTTKQTLITYSQAHDTMFSPSMGKVVLGGYAFQIHPAAAVGNTYQIEIGRPSATSDGIGTPGAGVYIATPTNGSLGAGAINAVKLVTVGQRKYVAGDCAPFRWFNAGDFGDTNLDNSDVEQVFQSAIYSLNNPPPNSDFFDSMDSCGGTYVDLGHGYLEFGSYVSGPAALNPLFDGNDTSINQIAFGDGVLDVCDVYVTFRRSLDPSLNWFRRFWTNGVRGAEVVFPQPKALSTSRQASPKLSSSDSITNSPSVHFAAADFLASAGQTLQVPMTAKLFGNYPLRVLMLNVSVVPLDGSPALTTPVQFIRNAALGTPTLTASSGNGNYAAAWLNSTIAGLTGNASLGTLTVTIPANAPSSAAYAIHFDHASASPNGVASFPKQTLTGLITLSSRTNSSYSDGIPDAWRLRWFGTIYNALSAASADACGDGISNWQKYVAGTDPTDPHAYPRLNALTPIPAGAYPAIHWPSVSGKQYVLESSATLFPGSWTAIATNTGTGTEMEFDDNSGAQARFYRVQILP